MKNQTDMYFPLPALQYSYVGRILQLLFITFVGLIAAVVAMGIIMLGGVSVTSLRLATVVQDILLFIVPAIVLALSVTRLPARLLCIDSLPSALMTAVALLVMIVSIPAMNAVVEWNASMSLPQSLAPIEAWMRHAEEAAQTQIDMMLGGTSVADLIINILIVGVLAGVSEELFFRGTLMRILSSGRLGIHGAIWLTAILFSVFHMQFFGFFPRMLLGVFFGYLLYWSGSIWLPAFLHACNNTLVVYVTWRSNISPESGIEEVNAWGTDSVFVIICSLLATAAVICFLLRMFRQQKI